MPTIHDFMDLTNDSDDDNIVILPKDQLVRGSSSYSTSLHRVSSMTQVKEAFRAQIYGKTLTLWCERRAARQA